MKHSTVTSILKLTRNHPSYAQTMVWGQALIQLLKLHPVTALLLAKTACQEIDKATEGNDRTYALKSGKKDGTRKASVYVEGLTQDSNAQAVVFTLSFIDKAHKAGIARMDTGWLLRKDLREFIESLEATDDVAGFIEDYDKSPEGAPEAVVA